jgi:hypothetical protein
VGSNVFVLPWDGQGQGKVKWARRVQVGGYAECG